MRLTDIVRKYIAIGNDHNAATSNVFTQHCIYDLCEETKRNHLLSLYTNCILIMSIIYQNQYLKVVTCTVGSVSMFLALVLHEVQFSVQPRMYHQIHWPVFLWQDQIKSKHHASDVPWPHTVLIHFQHL